MEFTALGAEMAQLAGRLGSVDPAAADRADLERSLRAARRLRGMTDAREALVTYYLESMVDRGVPVDEATSGDGGDPGGHDSGDGSAGHGTDAPGTGGRGGSEPAGDQPAGEGPVDGAQAEEADGTSTAGVGPLGEGVHRETAQEYAVRLARSKWLRRLPLFAAALEAGTITTAHLDALTAVLGQVEMTVVADVIADEAGLLEVARTGTRASFARYLRLRVDRVRDDGGAAALKRQIADSFGSLGYDDDLGLHRLFVQLDPIRGEQVYTAIRHRVDRLQQSGAADGMRRGQVIAQAITDLICGTATTGGAGGVEILVLVDALTLLSGKHDASICETGDGHAIPVDTIRDLCRQAGTTITAAIIGPDGTTIAVGQHMPPDDVPGEPASRSTHDGSAASTDGCEGSTDDIAAMVAAAVGEATGTKLTMGRDIRLANRQQRRALRAMYRSCAHPGCRVPFADCFIHHVTPWEHAGLTDLDNLLPLCGRHHHQVHDSGWRLTIDTARTLSWYQPGGTLDFHAPFQPLGATSPLHTPNDAAVETEPDDDDTADPAARPADRARTAGGTATTNAWGRSRSARGSPPTHPARDPASDPPRLFDPAA